ncbi:hypothetical protein F7O44_04535 [Phytoactinopolyspora sp. XMNu-373]|uniref:Uncharacterized protein n=2 Tax=Phytoactinopolyspora mesophila TaxID=2650750 RepID=A0A7K3LZ83_9ACTN|nr:hypothetical protein [Phytoactinopolyspora mesophila]
MTRPHPLTAMKEREWSQAWEEQQRIVDEQLKSQRGSWLPNVVERRRWGAMRWTSGRPGHAASSGRAVAETFVVLRPDRIDDGATERIVEALEEPAPTVRVLGFGLQRHHLIGLASGAAVVALLAVLVAAVTGMGAAGIILGIVVGGLAGAAGGAFASQYYVERQRAAVLADEELLRTVLGRYAPKSWTRLVEAASALEAAVPKNGGTRLDDPDTQTVEAIHIAMWEAAGLLLSSSDHTGMDVLAEGVERLERAHRGA